MCSLVWLYFGKTNRHSNRRPVNWKNDPNTSKPKRIFAVSDLGLFGLRLSIGLVWFGFKDSYSCTLYGYFRLEWNRKASIVGVPETILHVLRDCTLALAIWRRFVPNHLSSNFMVTHLVIGPYQMFLLMKGLTGGAFGVLCVTSCGLSETRKFRMQLLYSPWARSNLILLPGSRRLVSMFVGILLCEGCVILNTNGALKKGIGGCGGVLRDL